MLETAFSTKKVSFFHITSSWNYYQVKTLSCKFQGEGLSEKLVLILKSRYINKKGMQIYGQEQLSVKMD